MVSPRCCCCHRRCCSRPPPPPPCLPLSSSSRCRSTSCCSTTTNRARQTTWRAPCVASASSGSPKATRPRARTAARRLPRPRRPSPRPRGRGSGARARRKSGGYSDHLRRASEGQRWPRARRARRPVFVVRERLLERKRRAEGRRSAFWFGGVEVCDVEGRRSSGAAGRATFNVLLSNSFSARRPLRLSTAPSPLLKNSPS